MLQDARALRIAGWAGIAFGLLSVVVVPMTAGTSPPPSLGGEGPAFAAWYRAHRVGFLVGNWLGIAAFIPGFVQLAVLAARLRAAPRGQGWGGLVLATGTFTYSVFACSLIVFQALPFVVAPAHAEAAYVLGTLCSLWFSLDGLAAVPFVLAVGAAAAATGALPRSFVRASWATAVLAVVMSLGSLKASPAWLAAGGLLTFFGFGAFFAWTTWLAVVFLRQARE